MMCMNFATQKYSFVSSLNEMKLEANSDDNNFLIREKKMI